MALRIAVGLIAALRAVLVYGEVDRLTTHPVRMPRLSWRRPAAEWLPPRREPA